MRQRIIVALFLGALATSTACGGEAPPGEAADRVTSPILAGQASGVEQDSVVLVEAPTANGKFDCTGTLLAPNLVLTARHCTSELASYEGFTCDQAGVTVAGNSKFGKDRPPSGLNVYVRGNKAVAAVGKRVLHNGAPELCSNDIALILLDRNVPNAKTSAVRLDGKPRLGETFTAVGFGLTDSGDAGTRFERTGVTVLRVGPATPQNGLAVPPNDFEAGEAICEGDSGGPAIASTGAVIGVVSRGGNGTDDPPPKGCKNARNHYTSTAPFKDLILQAYTAAGATPQNEVGGSSTLTETGQPCTADAQCAGGFCVSGGAAKVCSQACGDNDACPGDFTCARTTDGKRVCAGALKGGGTAGSATPTTPAPKGGCAAASVGASPAGAGLVALVAALLASRRRRRGG